MSTDTTITHKLDVLDLRSERMRASQDRFLTAFATCGMIVKACRWAGVHREAHWRWMRDDPSYPPRFAVVCQRKKAVLEDQAMKMAVEGSEENVLYQGQVVKHAGKIVTKKVYDPAMVRFLLAHLDPETYGDKRVVELRIEDWDGDLSKLSEESARRLLAQIEARIAAEEAKLAALPAPGQAD